MAGRSRAVRTKANQSIRRHQWVKQETFIFFIYLIKFIFKEIDLNCAVQLRNKNHIYVYEPDHIGDESEDEEHQEWQLAENEENGAMGEEEDESGVGSVF